MDNDLIERLRKAIQPGDYLTSNVPNRLLLEAADALEAARAKDRIAHPSAPVGVEAVPGFSMDDMALCEAGVWSLQESDSHVQECQAVAISKLIQFVYAALAQQPAPSAPVGVEGTWLWCKLMDWCRERRIAPATQDKLFAIAGEAHRLNALTQQPAAVDGAATNSAVAAIQFALKDPEGMTFLRLWNEGEFDTLRREWPDAPVEVYIGADPLATQHQEPTT